MRSSLTLHEHVARLQVMSGIAEFRSQIGRPFFFALTVAFGRNSEEKGHYKALLATALEKVNWACDALGSSATVAGADPQALAWARSHAARSPDLLRDVRAFHGSVLQAISLADQDPQALVTFLLDVAPDADALFGGAFAALLSAMEKDLSDADEIRAKASRSATEEARAAMGRIDAISRSVRLISLNAAVEAARVGDAGRGFTVISGEIKTLAEAIADTSQSAGRSMDKLQKLAGGAPP